MATKREKELMQKIGRKGGLVTKKRGSSYYAEIGQKGLESRYGKKKKLCTHHAC